MRFRNLFRFPSWWNMSRGKICSPLRIWSLQNLLSAFILGSLHTNWCCFSSSSKVLSKKKTNCIRNLKNKHVFICEDEALCSETLCWAGPWVLKVQGYQLCYKALSHNFNTGAREYETIFEQEWDFFSPKLKACFLLFTLKSQKPWLMYRCAQLHLNYVLRFIAVHTNLLLSSLTPSPCNQCSSVHLWNLYSVKHNNNKKKNPNPSNRFLVPTLTSQPSRWCSFSHTVFSLHDE